MVHDTRYYFCADGAVHALLLSAALKGAPRKRTSAESRCSTAASMAGVAPSSAPGNLTAVLLAIRAVIDAWYARAAIQKDSNRCLPRPKQTGPNAG